MPSAPPDYVDVFELRWTTPDHHSTEEWLRAGLEGSPRLLRSVILVAHRAVLGFRLGPLDSPAHVLGWGITADEPDVTVLEARARWFDGVIAARRVDETTATLTTSLHYRRVPARVVWTAVGPIHRLVAPYLLARAASMLGVPGHHRAVRVPPG